MVKYTHIISRLNDRGSLFNPPRPEISRAGALIFEKLHVTSEGNAKKGCSKTISTKKVIRINIPQKLRTLDTAHPPDTDFFSPRPCL